MSLAIQLSHEFTRKVRNKGAGYYRNGAVEIVSHTDSQVDAIVSGTEDYLVRLTLGRVALNVACTCPYFDGGDTCKHLWATMLKADAKLYLADANPRSNLKLNFDYDALDELRDLQELELLQNGQMHVDARHLRRSSDSRDKVPQPKPSLPLQAPLQVEPLWKKQLETLTNSVRAVGNAQEVWPPGREIIYLVDAEASRIGKLILEIGYRERTVKGEWGKVKYQRIPFKQIRSMQDAADRQILTLLSGAKDSYTPSYYYNSDSLFTRCYLSAELQQLIYPLMCATGRCWLRRFDKDPELPALVWDHGEPWEFVMTARPDQENPQYVLGGLLRRGAEETEISAPILLVEGLVVTSDYRVARLAARGVSVWVEALKRSGEFRIPATDADDLIERLLALPEGPKLELPQELQFEKVQVAPQPHLSIRASSYIHNKRLEADLAFTYEGTTIEFSDVRRGLYDRSTRRFLVRDREAEQLAAERLKPLGFKSVLNYYEHRRKFDLAPGNLPRAVKTLLAEGWKVEAEGKLYRNPGSISMSVSSGIDWFELHGAVDFGEGLQVRLPALLSALKRGETMVQLGDGSFGLLPDDWLKKYFVVASLGDVNDDHLRFKQTQTGVLDALLAAQPEIKSDEIFARAREEWRNFKGIESRDPPETFVGTLREYQREGLGWFEFLKRFRFGGCLADDMGLGKTVQVLALLDSRRVARLSRTDNGHKNSSKRAEGSSRPPASSDVTSGPHTSLVVVPRSLIFNWQQEAERFTPHLRVLSHLGAERTKGREHFEEYDLILTTYGTLRRDALHFKDADFDYVILDESQAIKNAKTESAKAVRLLKGRHRLALSGTPIENHLGELWSLFEFLNPGMLGAASVLQLSGNGARLPSEETKALLARALRPFILRRTKQQVAKELPEKLEQTIYCEMEPAQRKLYAELRDYYRVSLLERVEQLGINRAKIHILEALLRLRQAACHPALIARSEGDEPSAKLDLLIPRLGEVTEEGHKALVFSQFTSFLAIVRRRLDEEGVSYEYLDGKTRDRAARVGRFQNDPQCKIFLISLKAGGLGLNLTAAEYVFLLDPWWNPAVEAQAIDRAHRIGQSQRVFAYRLITRETVEEKVLALQATKKELADAIISADSSLIKSLTGEDLLLLLS